MSDLEGSATTFTGPRAGAPDQEGGGVPGSISANQAFGAQPVAASPSSSPGVVSANQAFGSPSQKSDVISANQAFGQDPSSPAQPKSIAQEGAPKKRAGWFEKKSPEELAEMDARFREFKEKNKIGPREIQGLAMSAMGPAAPLATALAIPLSYIERGTTSLAMQGAEMVGVPGAKEFNDKHNPDRKYFPDVMPGDITSFYMDKGMARAGLPPEEMGSIAKLAYGGGKALSELAVNFAADPLRLVHAGTFTEEATALQKKGDTSPASQTRDLLKVRAPFSNKTASIPMDNPVVNALNKIPGVQMATKAIRQFSPDTGVPEVDRARNMWNQENYAIGPRIKTGYLAAESEKSYTPAEKQMIYHLAENTENLSPAVSPEIIKAAKGKLSGDEGLVRAKMMELAPAFASGKKLDLAPDRMNQIIESAMNAKKSDTRALEWLVHNETIHPGNVNDFVLQNHMPHEMNPAYKGESAEIDADLRTKGMIPTKGITAKRQVQGNVLDINAYVKRKYGIDQYFIEDPFVATATREDRAMRAYNNSQFLSTVAKYGIEDGLLGGEARKAGWKEIKHPEFAEKEYTIVTGLNGQKQTMPKAAAERAEALGFGKAQTVRHSKLLFPPDIASKVQYYVNKGGSFSFMDSLGSAAKYVQKGIEANKFANETFRTTAYASTGIFGRNIVNNVIKAVGDGMHPKQLYNAIRLIGVKAPELFGFKPFGEYALKPREITTTAINPRTKVPYASGDLANLVRDSGLTQGNIFHDGIGNIAEQGKQLTLQQVVQSKGRLLPRYTLDGTQALLKNLVLIGEHGENAVRVAHFLQKLEDGWHPTDAAIQVNKALFDYRVNSPLTDTARFFSPTIQHPIKSALYAPEMIGKNPALWNFTMNTFPRVLNNAFHDPVTQDQMKQAVPSHLLASNPILGPVIPGNSVLFHMLGGAQSPGQLGLLSYFKTADVLGLGILNHFDYFSEAARSDQAFRNYGLSPFWGAMLGVVQGHDNKGKSLDGTQNLGYLLRQGMLGNIVMPNSEKVLKEAVGLKEEDPFDSTAQRILRANFGTFGGVSDLDADFIHRAIALKSAAFSVDEKAKKEMGPLLKELAASKQAYSSFTKSNRDVMPMTNAELVMEAEHKFKEQKAQVMGHAAAMQAAQAGLQGKTLPQDYIARRKLIDQELANLKLAHQVISQRYREMAAGAKNTREALEKAGLKLHKPGVKSGE